MSHSARGAFMATRALHACAPCPLTKCAAPADPLRTKQLGAEGWAHHVILAERRAFTRRAEIDPSASALIPANVAASLKQARYVGPRSPTPYADLTYPSLPSRKRERLVVTAMYAGMLGGTKPCTLEGTQHAAVETHC